MHKWTSRAVERTFLSVAGVTTDRNVRATYLINKPISGIRNECKAMATASQHYWICVWFGANDRWLFKLSMVWVLVGIFEFRFNTNDQQLAFYQGCDCLRVCTDRRISTGIHRTERSIARHSCVGVFSRSVYRNSTHVFDRLSDRER